MANTDPLAGATATDLLDSPIATKLYKRLVSRTSDNRKIDRYLDGRHDLSFATQKFMNAFGMLFRETSENQFPRIINGLTDYLRFQQPEKGSTPQYMTCANADATDDLNIWLQAQLFPVLAGQVHADAYTYGNGYSIVGLDRANNPRIYRQDARQLSVIYDPEEPTKLLAAMKVWEDDLLGTWRLNIYTQSATFRYTSATKLTPGLKKFVPITDDSDVETLGTSGPGAIDHKVPGIVPVFHFPNNPDASGQGRSECLDLFGPQDALNKTKCDRLVTQEYQSYRQRWSTGIEADIDPQTNEPKPWAVPAVDRLWSAASPEAKFGEFEPINVEQFLAAARDDRAVLAILAGLPVHHLVPPTSDWPSGESQKTAEMPALNKAADRKESWGAVWASVAQYWFMLTEQEVPQGIACNWCDMTPRDKMNEAQGDLFEAQAYQAKNELGVPKAQLLLEMGYTQDQIEEFEAQIQEEQEASAAASSAMLAGAINRAQLGGTGGSPGGGSSTAGNVADPTKADGLGKKVGAGAAG